MGKGPLPVVSVFTAKGTGKEPDPGLFDFLPRERAFIDVPKGSFESRFPCKIGKIHMAIDHEQGPVRIPARSLIRPFQEGADLGFCRQDNGHDVSLS
jgi:hypothetical protein